MNLTEVVLPCPPPKRSHCLDERCILDITDCATKFNDAHIRGFIRVINRYGGNTLDPILNGIRDVRNDLDGFPQVPTLALLFDDVLVYLAGGDVVLSSQCDIQVSFVIAKVEIDFSTVVKNKHLPMPNTKS